MHTLRIRLFARFRDIVGADFLDVPIRATSTVGELRTRIGELHPALIPLLDRSQVAVNNEIAGDAIELNFHDEIALIPPVSGG